MLTVGFLGSGFVGRFSSGTAQVSRKLVIDLLKKHQAYFRIVIFLKTEKELQLAKSDPGLTGAEFVVFPNVYGKYFRSFRMYMKYSLKNRNRKIDILHFSVPRSYPFYWLFPAKSFVSTFHAAGDVTIRQEKFVFSKHVYNFVMKTSWSKLKRIYCVSDFAKAEIQYAYRIPSRRITKIYPGTDTLWTLEPEPFYLPPKDLIVIVGRWQIFKNVHTVLDAIRQYEYRLERDFHIVLLARQNNATGRVGHSVAQFDQDKLTLIEYLPETQLKYLYKKANVVIHPSINEGFGIPAFEAFGEGAKLIVHRETPAADELSWSEDVATINALDHSEVFKATKDALHAPIYTDIATRREFLRGKKMTWGFMADEYARDYLEVRAEV